MNRISGDWFQDMSFAVPTPPSIRVIRAGTVEVRHSTNNYFTFQAIDFRAFPALAEPVITVSLQGFLENISVFNQNTFLSDGSFRTVASSNTNQILDRLEIHSSWTLNLDNIVVNSAPAPQPIPEPVTILGSVVALGLGTLMKQKKMK